MPSFVTHSFGFACRAPRLALALVAGVLVGGLAACSAPQKTLLVGTGVDETAQIREATRLFTEAQAAESSKDKTRAIDLYRQSIAAYPKHAPAWNNLGLLLLDRAEYRESAAAFERAADLWPQDPRPITNLAMVWERNGYPADALKHYLHALDRDDSYLPALRGCIKMELLLDKGDEQTARRVKRATLLETDPAWRAFLERAHHRLSEYDPKD